MALYGYGNDIVIKMSCADLYGGEWVRVRHVPSGNIWHPATDALAGTAVYGTEGVDNTPWSVNFASKLPATCRTPYTEFLFATGDCTKWLVATTDAVIGDTYVNADRPILASSDGSNYVAKWYNRAGAPEDPWISITDHVSSVGAGKFVYGEGSNAYYTYSFQSNGGADVYVRSACRCEHLHGGEWVRVRHVPSGNTWHPATDALAGTAVYGTEGVDNAPWSVNFASKLPAGCPYTEFLFATGDCTKWLVATTDAVIGDTYANADRPILASSDGSNYVAKWYNRAGAPEDPWITIIDHGSASGAGKFVYGEGSNAYYTHSFQSNEGADVYVRDPDCPSSQPSLNPSFSTNPTLEPSSEPSSQPSSKPSSQPSSEPSSEPSSQPSSQPSLSPSGSVQPSSEPSLNPSFSTNPTSEPSSEPSSQPSSQPSLSPSGSVQPSSVPSLNPSFTHSKSSIPSITPSSKIGGKVTVKFEVSMEMLFPGVDFSTFSSNELNAMVLFLESVLGDYVPRGSIVDLISFEDVLLATSLRELQGGAGAVHVVFEVTLTVLCSPEEACDAAKLALLQSADDVSSDIASQGGSITASILSAAAEGVITALQGFTGIDSIEVSDPVAIVTLRSDEPSSAPSSSSQPSESSEPSLVPSKSAQPSLDPSSQPSFEPSLDPSSGPSSEPSSQPSSEPSSQPSSVPSSQPSSEPSSEPSSQPSSEPSSEPSSTPSCSPSSAPTESPSRAGGVNLFYPLWTSGSEGCR